jgi:hypothetical protein
VPASTRPDEYADFFDPRRYLQQYYSLPRLPPDDVGLFRALCGWLRRTGRTFATALDVGCGPTLHYSFALTPYAERIDLADYLPANLSEIRKWLDGTPDAHNWDPLLRGVLECDGVDHGQLPSCKALYRKRVASLRRCDLREPAPLGEPLHYDLVTSFFCAECVAASRGEWREVMGRLLGLVRSGGSVFLAAMRQCERYAVLGRWFRSTPLTEQDFYDLLPRHDFTEISAQSVPAPNWADDGFDHICLVHATRR